MDIITLILVLIVAHNIDKEFQKDDTPKDKTHTEVSK